MKKPILIFTPHNPLRPFAERLIKLHRKNVEMNDSDLYDYIERECVLPTAMQKEGLYRGQNVIVNFNEVYHKNKGEYEFICKWDDDIILPPNILEHCYYLFRIPCTQNNWRPQSTIGVGLFEEDYGAPNILMVNQRDSFYGAFSRFYIYRMEIWREIPVNIGSPRGDPDNAFQINLQGKKCILNTWSIHLDHRAINPHPTYGYAWYKTQLEIAEVIVQTFKYSTTN